MALIAHWSCDDLSLPTVPDVSGNGRHGTAVGNVAAVAGRVGGGLQLDGDDDYVEVPHDAALNLGIAAFTIAVWIHPTGWSGQAEPLDQGRILAKGTANPSTGGSGWTFAIDGTGSGGIAETIFFDVNTEGRRRAANAAITLNVWQHVAVRYDNGDLQLFVGGAPSGPLHTNVGLPGANTSPLRMGIQTQALLREWIGLLDDLRIYDQALSDSAIAELATVQTVAIGAGAVTVAGQGLTATTDEALARAQVTVAGQELGTGGAVTIGAGQVDVEGQALIVLPRPLAWKDQIFAADRFAPLASPPAKKWFARSMSATLTGPWSSGAPFVSPVNPFSFRSGGAAWLDIAHHASVFGRGVTIWMEIAVHAIAARGVLITTGGGDQNGQFSVEIQPPASGSLVRAWFVEGGTPQFFGGSSSINGGVAGSKITPDVPMTLALTMGENGAALAVNGHTLATLPTIGTWLTSGLKRVGAWTDDGAALDFTLGDLRFYGALSPHQVEMMHASWLDWWSRLGFGVVSPAAAAVDVAGQALLVDDAVELGAGAVSVAGQDLTTPLEGEVAIGAGAVSVGGQDLATVQTVAIAAGAVTAAGQDLTANVAASGIEFVETPGVLTGQGSDNYSISVAINGTGPNRKLVFHSHYAAGADRAVTRSYNLIPATEALENTAGNGNNNTWQGYIDEAMLPTDGAEHPLAIESSDGNFSPEFGCVLYRGVASGAPAVTGSNVEALGTTSVTLNSVSDGALVATTCGNNSDTSFTPSGTEAERIDQDNPSGGATGTVWAGDLVGVSAGNITTGAMPAGGSTRQISCAYDPA